MTSDASEDHPERQVPPPTPDEPKRSRREVGGRDLPIAIGSGVLLAGTFLGSLYWNATALAVVVGGLIALGVVETSRTLARHNDIHLATPVLLAATVVALVGAHEAGESGLLLAAVLIFLGSVLWELAAPDRDDVVRNAGTSVLVGLWVVVNGAFAILLVGGGDGPHTPAAMLLTAGAAIFTDIGGFAFGVRFGKHKIAPSVSPKKSWEGLLGGLALVAILAALVVPPTSDYDLVTSVVVAVCAGLAGFFGDLIESMVKRDLGVKDLGDLIPGHGGVLDRVDGILLSMPVGYYLLQIMA